MLKTKTVKVVTVQDWDYFVFETYGKPYMFQQQDGCKERGKRYFDVPSHEWIGDYYKNDEIPFEVNGEKMGVSFESWLNTSLDDTLKQFEDYFDNSLFWERNFYPHLEMIVNDLHSKGLLEEGRYMIDIDW